MHAQHVVMYSNSMGVVLRALEAQSTDGISACADSDSKPQQNVPGLMTYYGAETKTETVLMHCIIYLFSSTVCDISHNASAYLSSESFYSLNQT